MASLKIFLPLSNILLQRSYAKSVAATTTPAVKGLGSKKMGKAGHAVVEKKVIPVETDPNRLVNYVCGSNYFVEGEDIKLKPDSEYPDWLWNIHTGKPKTLDELDPNTKQYWKRLRQMALKRNAILRRVKKF